MNKEARIITPQDIAHPRLISIKAVGPLVQIELSDGDYRQITRKEALLRARGIAGMHKDSMDVAEQLIIAANEARKNEFGEGYSSARLNEMKEYLRQAGVRWLGKPATVVGKQ